MPILPVFPAASQSMTPTSITIYGKPTVSLPLSAEDLLVLNRCSQWHYDASCREFREHGQFLFQWAQQARAWQVVSDLDEAFTGTVAASFRDLDGCLKCLEMPYPEITQQEDIHRQELSRKFQLICQRMNELSAQWQEDVPLHSTKN